jgi:HAD superfamily hydrolase (TIGR01509 family)
MKAVTFDFWNTLAHEPAGHLSRLRADAVLAALRDHGVPVEADEVERHLAAVGREHQASWSAGRLFTAETAAERLTQALGVSAPASEGVATAFLDAGGEAELELAPDIRDCLEALRARGTKLGIICDVGFTSGSLLRGFLRRQGLLDHFAGWAFSDEVGAYKPSPRMFRHALRALDVAPEEAVHVGDLRRTDVAGARAAGMRTVRYRGLVDDPETQLPDADVVIDSHRELVS